MRRAIGNNQKAKKNAVVGARHAKRIVRCPLDKDEVAIVLRFTSLLLDTGLKSHVELQPFWCSQWRERVRIQSQAETAL